MTEAAKRDLSPEEGVNDDIATDDPLFELSQIMGIDDSVASEPGVEIDPQIDLEDALLAELATEPELDMVEATDDDPAPTAESLEDELTSMLGDTVSVASEVPAPALETEAEIVGNEDVADLESHEDDELESIQLNEAVADADSEMDAEFEPVSAAEVLADADLDIAAGFDAPDLTEMSTDQAPEATEIETTFDDGIDALAEEPIQMDTSEDAISEIAGDEFEPATALDSSEQDALLAATEAEIDLEKDFAAFFEEELPDTPLSLSTEGFEEPAAEQGEALQPEMVADPEAVALSELEEQDPIEALADLAVDDFSREAQEATAQSDVEPSAEQQIDPEQPDEIEQEPLAESAQEYAEDIPEAIETAGIETRGEEDISRPEVSDQNAGIDEIVGEDSPPISETVASEPVLPAAPVLETTDMSAYEAANAIEVDVPELPDLENEFVAAFDHDSAPADDAVDQETDDETNGVAAAIGATVAAAGATVLSRRAGETAMDADDEAFDETRFEAELARDMEFVSHDLSIADDDNPETENELDDQEFAAAAAAQKPAKRGLMIAAVLGCLAIAGAAGLFVYSGGTDGNSDAPVLVEASEEPVKIAPENPGGVEVPNQDRAVFAENVVVPEQEALVPTAEEPIDIAAVPETALPSSLNGSPEAQKGDDRLIPEASETTSATDEIGALLAPRKVRTLVVKPDGTLVEREVVPSPEPVAPAAVAAPEPVVTETIETTPAPSEPAVAETTTEPTAPVIAEPTTETQVVATETSSVATPEVEPTTTASAVDATAPAPESQTVNEAVAEIAAVPVATPEAESTEVAAVAEPEIAVAPSTSIATPGSIADRPKDQPLNIVNQPAAAPATQTAAAPAATAQAAVSSPFSVQLASLPSQELAQNAASNLSRQYSNVIGNRGLTIREAQIEGRGTFYRVRVGASDRADANRICSSIKSAGGDCFVTR